MPASARSWKSMKNNVLYCILLQDTSQQIEWTSDPLNKAFHPINDLIL